jgi:hypothetical protein
MRGKNRARKDYKAGFWVSMHKSELPALLQATVLLLMLILVITISKTKEIS